LFCSTFLRDLRAEVRKSERPLQLIVDLLDQNPQKDFFTPSYFFLEKLGIRAILRANKLEIVACRAVKSSKILLLAVGSRPKLP